MNNNYNYLFKYILIGDTNVGKSALLLQFVYQRFQGEYDATIGVEFGSKLIKVRNKTIKLQIWDTAGQESFRSITRSYYKGSIAAFLVYDVAKRSSFENIRNWLSEAKSLANEKVFYILVANKNDLEKREVSFEEGQEFARINNLTIIETSAKTGDNIEEAFTIATSNVLAKIDSGEINPITDSTGIKLGPQTVCSESTINYGSENKSRCCCK